MNRPTERQEWIYERLVANPHLTYTEVRTDYELIWSLGNTTFAKDWKVAAERHKDYQLLVSKAKQNARISVEVKAAKEGVRSRIERVMILQDQCDQLVDQIASGKTKFTILKNGKTETFDRPMNSYELNNCRSTLRELQAEISKIEGDYAAETHILEIMPILSDDVYLNNDGDKHLTYELDSEDIEAEELS